jgi:hypothetical protein
MESLNPRTFPKRAGIKPGYKIDEGGRAGHLPDAFGECHPQGMCKSLLAVVMLVLFAVPTVCNAQDKGYWHAMSSNANKITGDITISESRLTINFIGYSLAPIRKINPTEAASVFDVDINQAGSGSVYRLKIPGDKRFLHHNTLCGSEDTEWMVTFVEEHTLHVALFSGAEMPVLTHDALANSTEVCGVFAYER